MTSFKLIQTKDLGEFEGALEQHGLDKLDFKIEEQVLDPAIAEVEAKLGDVIITCTRTHAVGVYPVGRGDSWVTDFAEDLRAGKFGSPSKSQA